MPNRDPEPRPGDKPDGGQPSARRSWRGKQAASQPIARHRWQRDWTKQQDADVRRRSRKFRTKLIAVWCLFIAMAGVFAWILLSGPRVAPFISAAVTKYDFPVRPNALALEDIEQFRDLDGNTLDIVSLSDGSAADWNSAWTSPADGLDRLKTALKLALLDKHRNSTLVVYLSMHGAVDLAAGRPRACLLPPHSAAVDAEKWLPVDQLLNLFVDPELDAQFGLKQRKKLLILDAHRLGDNWSLGQLYNGFGEALEQAVRDSAVPNLAVLASAAPGQTGWISPDRQHSIFGYYVSQALHGEADVTSDDDGEITLDELVAYVGERTDTWVRDNRADRQTPTLLTRPDSEFGNWVVASVPDHGIWANFARYWWPRQPVNSTSSGATAETSAPLNELWDARTSLRDTGALHRDPLAWQLFERRLMWGEQLETAGAAYADTRRDNLNELGSLAAQLRSGAEIKVEALATLPLARAFSSPAETDLLDAAQAAWEAGRRATSPQAVQSALDKLAGAATPDRFSELYFLQLLAHHLHASDWASAAEIERVLEIRDRAERLAAPADERVVPWIAPLVDAAESERRLAEDRLFVGGRQGQIDAATAAANADQLYELSDRLSASVSGAYQLRDAVAGDAPFLAEWLARRLPSALDPAALSAASNELDALLREQLLPLLTETNTLSQALAVSPADNLADPTAVETRIATIDRARAVVDGHWTTLLQAFDAECGEISELGGGEREFDLARLRGIGGVLCVPWIPANRRADYRANYAQTSTSLDQTFKESSAATVPRSAPEADDVEKATNPFLERLASWGLDNHPAVAILNAPAAVDQKLSVSSTTERLAALAELGEAVRRRLSEDTSGIDATAAGLVAASIGAIEQRPTPPPVEQRAPLGQADYLLRATADLRPVTNPQATSADATSRLRRFDLAQLLRWQANRTIEDFYGTPSAGAHYFDLAASRYLAEATELMRSVCDNAAPAPEQALLETRRKAAGDFKASAPVFENVLELAGTETGKAPHQLEVVPVPGLPAGLMSIYVDSESAAGRLPLSKLDGTDNDLRISAPTVPATSPGASDDPQRERREYAIDLSPLGENGLADAQINAAAFFRGHLREVPIEAGSVDIEFRPPLYKKPDVTVFASETARGELMFIFDCSGSMSRAVSAGGSLSRIDAARDALFGDDDNPGVLDRLHDLGLYRVGLRLYGHRIGQEDPARPMPEDVDADAIRLLNKPGDPILKVFPENWTHERYRAEMSKLVLGTDVDLVLPITAMTEAEYGEIRRLLLRDVRPWGITPLYYSIAASLAQDFHKTTDVSGRRIVVLTDGLDQQTLDTSLTRRAPLRGDAAYDEFTAASNPRSLVDIQSLKDAFREHNKRHPNEPVQLDVVGFQVERAGDLVDLAKDSSGDFYSARDTAELIRALERSLGLNNFVVTQREGRTYGPGDFGKVLEIDHPPGRRLPYTVRVDTTRSPVDADIVLEGGESLELELANSGRKLVHRRFDRDSERDREENITDPDPRSKGRQLYIAAHLPPRRFGDEIRFPISVQSQDATTFSPRPVEAWAEIRPVTTSGADELPSYTFYDLSFENGRPVPVLGYEVPHWPSQAAQAEIRFWCKFFPTEPADHEVTVGEVARSPARTALPRPQTIDGQPGLVFEVETQQVGDAVDERWDVVVTVRHPAGADQAEPMKIEMVPPPVSVLRRYFNSNRLEKHYFRYEGVARRDDLDPHKLRFTSAAKLKQGAVELTDPLVVPVPER